MSQPPHSPYDPTQPFGQQPEYDATQPPAAYPAPDSAPPTTPFPPQPPASPYTPYAAPDSAPPASPYAPYGAPDSAPPASPYAPYPTPDSVPPTAPFPPQPYAPPVSKDGYPQSPAGYPPPAGYAPTSGYTPHGYHPMVGGRPTSGWSVASMVLGIVGIVLLPCAFGAFGVPSLLAVIFGHIGLAETKRGEKTGGGMAVAGLVLGYLFIGPGVLLMVLGGLGSLGTLMNA